MYIARAVADYVVPDDFTIAHFDLTVKQRSHSLAHGQAERFFSGRCVIGAAGTDL
jgi:hypothetical protein